MMGLNCSFQSERHIAPYVILLIVFVFYYTHAILGRSIWSVLRRSEAAVFSCFHLSERDMVSGGKKFGSVMRNVSKAKFDGSLLGFTLLERAK